MNLTNKLTSVIFVSILMILLCCGYQEILLTHSNSNHESQASSYNTLSSKDLKNVDINDINSVATGLLSSNFERFKNTQCVDANGCNFRIQDYKINCIKTQCAKDDTYYVYCEYSIIPETINCNSNVGCTHSKKHKSKHHGSSTENCWENCTKYYTIKKMSDEYVITNDNVSPSEDMLKGEFQ